MENVQNIEKLIKNSKEITNAFKKYESYKKDSSCDKNGFGFNLDERFSACQGLNIRVDSWHGYYGDSGCSRFISLDEKIFKKHLLKVIQSQFYQLMEKTAESIMKEALTLKDDAEKELTEKLEAIKSL